MPINSLPICHVLQHDLTHLQRSFSESDLQNFDVPSLIPRHERQFDDGDDLPPSQTHSHHVVQPLDYNFDIDAGGAGRFASLGNVFTDAARPFAFRKLNTKVTWQQMDRMSQGK